MNRIHKIPLILTALAIAIAQLACFSTPGAAHPALYPLQGGFPIDIPGRVLRSSPTVADLDDDGDNELLVANYGGQVYAWNASGSLLPGFPLDTEGHIIGHLAVGDLNGDGDLEIVAGAGSSDAGVEGKVFVWQPDGTPLPGWPQIIARFGDVKPSKVSTVSLTDIDGDSDLEVIAGTNNNVVGIPDPPDVVSDLYAWHHTGSLAAGNWPARERPAILGTIAAGDLDSDGLTDIVVGRDYDWLFAYDNTGSHLPGWPIQTLVPEQGSKNVDPRIAQKLSAPSLADLDRNGVVECIVAGIRQLPGSDYVISNDLLVLQPDGTRRPGWETPAGGVASLSEDYAQQMQQAPAIADLDGDRQLDIIVPTNDGWIRAYTADKALLWQFDFARGKFIYSSEPVIGDIDGDRHNEVIFGTYDPLGGTEGPVGVWILEHDGSAKSGAPIRVDAPGVMAAPTLADLNGDGHLDLIAATRKGEIYVWDTGSVFDPARLPWPVARHDIQRTAFVDPRSASPDLSTSLKDASPPVADYGETINYTLHMVRTGRPLTSTVQVTDVIPTGLAYIPGTLSASHGTVDDSAAPTLVWTGLLSDTTTAEITYTVRVVEEAPSAIANWATVNAGIAGTFTLGELVIVNGRKFYLPLVKRRAR